MHGSRALFAVTLLLACCSGNGDSADVDPSAGGGPPSPSPSSPGGGSGEGPPESTSPRDPSVLSQSFEDASPQCNDWIAEAATSIRSVPPHTGDYACKLCATGEAASFALARLVGPLPPGRYVFSAWVRTRPSWPGPNTVHVVFAADTASGGAVADEALELGDQYARVEAALDLPNDAPSASARIEAPGTSNVCLLIDDVNVTRAEP